MSQFANPTALQLQLQISIYFVSV